MFFVGLEDTLTMKSLFWLRSGSAACKDYFIATSIFFQCSVLGSGVMESFHFAPIETWFDPEFSPVTRWPFSSRKGDQTSLFKALFYWWKITSSSSFAIVPLAKEEVKTVRGNGPVKI